MVVLVLACGCASVPATVYRGTYTRSWVDAAGQTQQATGPVTFELRDDGRYRVRGEKPDLPPAGGGRFDRADNTIILHDLAPPRAGFDLSQILGGTFEVAADDGSLVLTQENLWGHSHLLLLEKALSP
jgi:hypothetical protein